VANKVPVVLELAPLPREQVGPFLLLGVEKTADKEQIEASWAQRVIWARKGQIKTPLEDVNWARETINDPDKRVRADAASINLDTTTGVLRKLAERYGGTRPAGGQPLDVEKALADYTPAGEIPDPAAERAAIVVPDVPQEMPAARELLAQLVSDPLDPWALPLPSLLVGQVSNLSGPDRLETCPTKDRETPP
jgi:hypothetical protein